jgi:hypothetical protein
MSPEATTTSSGSFTTLSNQPVAFWNFNNNGNDATGNGHTLTNNGSITYVTGKIGNAADFAASSTQYFSNSDSAFNSISGDMTLAAWIYVTSNASGQDNSIVSKESSGTQSFRWNFSPSSTFSNSTMYFEINGSSLAYSSSWSPL